MERPQRSPIEIPDLLSEHIKDKVVCEIGCGEGDLLIGFAKHAKKVYGLEIQSSYYDKLRRIEESYNNIKIFYRGVSPNIELQDIPEADLYYFWIDPDWDSYLIKKIREGKMAIQKASFNKGWIEQEFNKYQGKKEYIDFVPIEDTKFNIHGGTYNEKTPLVLGILEKRNGRGHESILERYNRV
jgi:hypothetical protein